MTAPHEYEPSAEAVMEMSKALNEGVRPGCWHVASIAAFILRRQHARESGLLEALREIADGDTYYGRTKAAKALAAHAKLDAPKVPTLLEAADALVRSACANKPQYSSVGTAEYQALKAAVEREEKR